MLTMKDLTLPQHLVCPVCQDILNVPVVTCAAKNCPNPLMCMQCCRSSHDTQYNYCVTCPASTWCSYLSFIIHFLLIALTPYHITHTFNHNTATRTPTGTKSRRRLIGVRRIRLPCDPFVECKCADPYVVFSIISFSHVSMM